MSGFQKIIKEKSDAELTDIFIQNSGYQEEFMSQVQEELIARKVPMESLIKMRAEQNKIDDATLSHGVQGKQFWIATGFAVVFIGILESLLLSGKISFFAAIWPLTLGYTYAYSKTKLKGKEYFVYNESTKKYGQIMLLIAVIILGVNLLRFFA